MGAELTDRLGWAVDAVFKFGVFIFAFATGATPPEIFSIAVGGADATNTGEGATDADEDSPLGANATLPPICAEPIST